MVTKKLITPLVTIVVIGFLVFYSLNYYKEYSGIVDKENIQGIWNCRRSAGFRDDTLNVRYKFLDNNTYSSSYKLITFGEQSKQYTVNIRGKYSINNNKILTTLETSNFIKGFDESDEKDMRLLKEAFSKKVNDNDLIILSLDNKHMDFTFTLDKNVKYSCSKKTKGVTKT